MTTSAIAPAQLAKQHEGKNELLVLDVRTPAEFETAHIEGSYNVPLETLTEHRDEVSGHLDRDVVLACRSGTRARQAESALSPTAPANLHVLHGGIAAWQAAGIGSGLTFAALTKLPYNRDPRQLIAQLAGR